MEKGAQLIYTIHTHQLFYLFHNFRTTKINVNFSIYVRITYKRRHNIKTLIFVYSLSVFSPLGFIRIYFSSKCELCSNKRSPTLLTLYFFVIFELFRGDLHYVCTNTFRNSIFSVLSLNSFKRT